MSNNTTQNLISFDEVIRLSTLKGATFGKGDPYNRLRYYIKIGLLPKASRKSFNGLPPAGALPISAVDQLVEIDSQIKSGKTIQQILKEKNDPSTSAPSAPQISDINNAVVLGSIPVAASPISPESAPELALEPVISSGEPIITTPYQKFLGKTGLSNDRIAVLGLEVLTLIVGIGILGAIYNFNTSKDNNTKQFVVDRNNLPSITQESGETLASTVSDGLLSVFVPTNITGVLTASGGIDTQNANINAGTGTLTASNVIYSINAGAGVSITSGQNPTISATGGGAPTGTANRIVVSGSQIDIASNYAGQPSITTVGTITSGTWNGTSISDSFITDTLTISSSSSVDWTALTSYPASCGVGNFVRAIGDTLTCAADQTGAGATIDIKLDDSPLQAATTLDFLANEFNILQDGGDPNEVNITIDYTSSGITRRNVNETLSGLWVVGNGASLTASGTGFITATRFAGSGSTTDAVDLATTEISGTLPILNGGTAATTSQGAINNISQLTTEGDLLYRDASNSTRLARGANGECLTSNATTIVWGTCGLGAEADTLLSVTTRGASTTVASSFTGGLIARGITVDTATATDDLLAVSVTTGGAARFTGTINATDLTANRTYTLPNAPGTFAVSASAPLSLNATTGDLTLGTVGIGSGGTGATTSQGAINNISQLTTEGDLLYRNATDTTRFPRGADGTCLGSNATTVAWVSCGVGAEVDTLASVTGRGATTSTASIFNGGLTARGITIDSATATDDLIAVTITGSGAARFTATITNTDLTADRTFTLPDAGGTFAVSAASPLSLSAAGQISLGTVGIGNGGTGATTSQGAINNLSQLTTNGDLLYHNGTNSTRFPRGADGQCLASNATTIVWGTCGLGAEADTLATVTGRGATTATASSFTGGLTARGITIDTATATDDLIAVSVTAGGASRFTGTISAADLTNNRTYTLPDAAGTFALSGNLGNSLEFSSNVFNVKLPAAADALSSTTNSGSGLEILSGGLTLLQGCSDLQILKWSETNDRWECQGDSGVGAEADTLQTVTSRGATTNLAITTRGITVDNATANSDLLSLSVTAAGSNTFTGTITNADLTANRSYTLPDVAGTFALSGNLGNSLEFSSNVFNVKLPAATDGLSSTTNSGSGLEILSTGLTLLQGCADTQILKWDETNDYWACSADSGVGAEADTLATVTGRGATTATASSFTGGATIRGLTIDTATATDDLIALSVTTGGAGQFTGTITNADLTATRTYTLPNVSGTFATSGNLGNSLEFSSSVFNVKLPAATDALSSTTNSGSGLEILASGLTLLQGCADTQILKWDETNDYWACAADSGVGAEADTLATVTGRGATTATASSFTGGLTARGLTVDSATATEDLIAVSIAAVGSNRFTGTITNADLTANRTFTLPDVSGTFATSGNLGNSLEFSSSVFNVKLPASADALSSTTSSGSGLEIIATGLTLLQGCSNTQILKWNETSDLWECQNDSGLTSEADTLATVTGRGATTSTASSFTGGLTARGLTVDTATGTDDLLAISVTSGGAARFTGTITSADLTGSRTYTLPDVDGTFANSGNLGNSLTFGSSVFNVKLPAAADALSSTVQSGSGLEILSGGLTLLQGCSDTQVLKWSETSDRWECQNDSGIGSEADTLATVTGRGATTSTASSFTGGLTSRGLTVDSATATDDLIAVSITGGGGARFTGTITNANLTGDRTYTLPDAGGTFAVSAASPLSLSAAGQISLGTVGIGNGGTGATTSQGAINNLSQLTTEGDLLYRDASNSTRLARGANGECLKSNTTTILWGSCGLATEGDTLQTVTNRGATTSVASSFTGGATIRILTVDTATATDDLLSISTATGGAARFTGTITNTDLTADRTYTLPNAGGTFAISASAPLTLNSTTGNLTLGTVGIGNGGTGATTSQGAINNISQLTTEGDLLYRNSSDSTRLGRGANGECLKSNTTTILWGSCGIGAEADTLLSVTTRGASTTVASSFTGGLTARGITIDTATATDDLLAVSVTGGGAAQFTGTITAADLTASRTFTLPNVSGTFANSGNIGNSLEFSSNTFNVKLPASGDALSSTTSSGSGLEIIATGLTLLQGCGNTQILKWNETTDLWECQNDSGVGAEADTLQTVTSRGAITNVASSFTGGATIRGLTIDTATATDDLIAISVTAGGASQFTGTITNANLSAARTYTLPDESGTFCTTGSVCTGYVPTSRTLTAGTGLTGGGDLSANRTFNVDQAFNFAWTGVHSWTSTLTDTGVIQDINLTLGDDANDDVVVALNVDVTSTNTGNADGIVGLNLANVTNFQAGVTEYAIRIGNGWDAAIDFEGATDDAFEILLTAADATVSSKTFTLPNVSSGDICISNVACIATTGDSATSFFGAGQIEATRGGTGIDTSAATGVPSISSGTWSVNSVLPLSLGGTNKNITANAGAVVYSDGDSFELTAVAGGAGFCLQSGTAGTGAPTWASCATGANSPFISSGGEITKDASFVNDQIHFTSAQAGDYGLKVDTSVINTTDLLQITNTGFGPTSTGVDLVDLNFTQADDADATDSNNALTINVTSNSTDADIIRGLYVAPLAGGQTAPNSYGVYVDSAWDYGVYVDAGLITNTNAIAINSNLGSVLSDFSGDLLRINTGNTHSGATTVTYSGNYLDVSRANFISNASGTFSYTGDLASLSSNCTVVSGTCSDSSNILELNQQLSAATGAVLNILNSGTGAGIQFEAGTTVADGILWGSDTNLFRSTADTLRTNDNLTVDLDLIVSGGDITGLTSTNIDLGEFIANSITLSGTTTGTSATFLGLPVKTDSGDPTTTQANGAIYYNSNSNKFRCYENSAWKDCDTNSGATATLKDAYDNDDNGDNADIPLTATDGSIVFQPIAGTNIQINQITSAPTLDLLSLSNASLGTVTDGVDGLSINFETGDGTDFTNSALNIAVTSGGTAATDIVNGINIANTTGNSSTQNAINIGTGWDTGVNITGTNATSSVSGINISGYNYNFSGNGTANLANLSFTNNTTAPDTTNPVVNGLNISPTINTVNSLGGIYTTRAIQVNSPTISNCFTTNPAGCNYTAFNASTPTYTQTSLSVFNFSGLSFTGNALTQNTTAGTLNWKGIDINLPQITQTTGTVTADGIRVTIPTSDAITTAGTMNGLNIIAPLTSGPAAGTLSGINIGSLTSAGAGTEAALIIGTGWDNSINGLGTLGLSSSLTTGTAVKIGQGIATTLTGSYTGLNVDLNTNYTPGTNNRTGVSITALTSGTGASETALNIGTGWDAGIRTGSNVFSNTAPTSTSISETVTSINTSGLVGRSAALAIGANGYAVLADGSGSGGGFIHVCANATCSSFTTTATTASINTGNHYIDIAIGADGLPIVTFFNEFSGSGNDLWVSKCTNENCTTMTSSAVEVTNSVGSHNSIAIGTDGLPIIAYYDALANTSLRVAKCNDTDCTGTNETYTTVDNAADVGQYTSIAVPADGLPVIAYYDLTNTALKFVKCTTASCSSSNTPVQVDNAAAVGQSASLAIGVDGLPIISYYDATNTALKVAKCHNSGCTSSTVTQVDNTGSDGVFSSIAIGTDGLPVISYYNTARLKVAKCANISCTSNQSATQIAGETANTDYISLGIAPDGLPIIAYRESTAHDLKLVKCANEGCSSTTGTYLSGVDFGSPNFGFRNFYGLTGSFGGNLYVGAAPGRINNLYGADQPWGEQGKLSASGLVTGYGGFESVMPASTGCCTVGFRVTPPTTTVSGGFNIGFYANALTSSGGTDWAYAAGTGWDVDFNFQDTTPTIQIADTAVLTFQDGAVTPNPLCTITDAGTTGNLSCTGTITGVGTVGFWNQTVGVLSKATVSDRVVLQYGDANDTQLTIENTTNNVIPAIDAVIIDLSGNSTGIVNNGVDALFVKAEFGNGANNTNSGIHIDIDPVNTPSGDETFYGLNIDGISATSAAETAITIGSNWDTEISLIDTSPTISVGDGTTGVLSFTDGTNTLCTITDAGTTGNLSCTGTITGPAAGTVGYWTRSGTKLSPATALDAVQINNASSTRTTGELELDVTSSTAGNSGINLNYNVLDSGLNTTQVGLDIVFDNDDTSVSGADIFYAQRITNTNNASATNFTNALLALDNADTTAGSLLSGITFLNSGATSASYEKGIDLSAVRGFGTAGLHFSGLTGNLISNTYTGTNNQTGPITGVNLNFGSNFTVAGANNLTGFSFTPPASTSTGSTTGLNIGNITTSNGTDNAINIGTGWDNAFVATQSGGGRAILVDSATNDSTLISSSTCDPTASLNSCTGAVDINVDAADITTLAADSSTGLNIDYQIKGDGITDEFYAQRINWYAGIGAGLETSAALYIRNVDTANNSPPDSFIRINDEETAGGTAVGIKIESAHGMVGLDLTDSDITSAISLGTNDITASGSFQINLQNASNTVLSILNSTGGVTASIQLEPGAELTTTGAGSLGLGSTNATTIDIGGGSGATGCTVTNASGNLACSGVFTLTGATATISASTAATALSIDAGTSGAINIGNTSTGDVLLAGGSGATGCTVANSTGNLTCSGAIATTTTSGTQGWWSRTGTTLSPINSGDGLGSIGSISTTSGSHTFTFTSTANGVFTINGNSASTSDVLTINGNNTTSGNILDIEKSRTFTGALGTLNEVLVNRAMTSDDGEFLIGSNGSYSGSLVTFRSNCTLGSLDTCTDTSNILTLDQNYNNASGDVLLIDNDSAADSIELSGTTRTINSTTGNLDIKTTSSGNINLTAGGTGDIVFNLDADSLVSFSGGTTDIITGTNEDLTIAPNGTGSVQITSGVVSGTITDAALSITADSLTTGQAFSIRATSATNSGISGGSFITVIGPNGVTSGIVGKGVYIASDVGAGGSLQNFVATADNASGTATVLNIQAADSTTSTGGLNVFNIQNITAGAGTGAVNAIKIGDLSSADSSVETAINIGSGWDQYLKISSLTVTNETAPPIEIDIGVADDAINHTGIDYYYHPQSSGNLSSAGENIAFKIELEDDTVSVGSGSVYGLQILKSNNSGVNQTNALIHLYNQEVGAGTGNVLNGILIESDLAAGNEIEDGIDVSDAEINNAINVGPNIILGTTASVNFTDFDLGTDGKITIGNNIGSPVTIYRGAADVLQTDDALKQDIATTSYSTAFSIETNVWATNTNVFQIDTAGNAEGYSMISWNTYFGQEFSTDKADRSADSTQTLGDDLSWSLDLSGTGSCAASNPDDILPGVLRVTNTGAANHGCATYLGQPSGTTATHAIFAAANKPVLLMKVKTDSASANEHVMIGITGSSGANSGMMDGIWFANHNGTAYDGNWYGITRSGGTQSTTSSCGSVSTTQFALMKIVFETSTSIKYYIDTNVSDGINFTLCGTLSTNVYSSNGAPFVNVWADSSNSLTVDVDFFRVWQDDAPIGAEEEVSSDNSTDGSTSLETLTPSQTFESLKNTQEQIKALNTLATDSAGNTTATLSAGSKFNFVDVLGNVVASISDTGDAIFSSIQVVIGRIQNLIIGERITIKKDANIAGVAKFEVDDTEVFIPADKVKDNSLVYVTPKTKTAGLNLYVKEIRDGEGFVVALEKGTDSEATQSATRAIEFNWLIVDQEN